MLFWHGEWCSLMFRDVLLAERWRLQQKKWLTKEAKCLPEDKLLYVFFFCVRLWNEKYVWHVRAFRISWIPKRHQSVFLSFLCPSVHSSQNQNIYHNRTSFAWLTLNVSQRSLLGCCRHDRLGLEFPVCIVFCAVVVSILFSPRFFFLDSLLHLEYIFWTW